MDLHISAGVLWDQLESAGIQDIVGVYNHTSYLTVVAIKQKYAGHAKQAGYGGPELRRGQSQRPLRRGRSTKTSIPTNVKKCFGR